MEVWMNDRDLSPKEAVERFLRRYRGQHSEKTIRSYETRLEKFVVWSNETERGSMATIDGWDLDEFYHWRSDQDVRPVTVKGTMVACTQLIKYCESLDILPEGTYRRVPTVVLSDDEESSDINLPAERAGDLLDYYRGSSAHYGTTNHAFLELAWHTGARLGGIRALDIDDFDADAGTLYFKNRPDTGTRLKNGAAGERIVEVNPTTVEVLVFWIERDRPDKADGFGRDPFFSTRQGRASSSSLRSYCYLATQPCVYRQCPHGRERHSCEYIHRNHASKCPSSRSPHPVRTGSITWQLDRTGDIEYVSERVNAAPETIRRYYDVSTVEQRYRERRKGIGKGLDVTEGEQSNE